MGRGLLDVLCHLVANEFCCLFQQFIRSLGFLNACLLIRRFQSLIRLRLNGQLRIGDLFRLNFLCLDNITGFEDGIATLRLCQNISKFIVGGQHNGIHITIPGALTIRQTQTTADHLLTQNLGGGSTQRNDGIEVIDIPSFFEHIDMDNDFYRVIGAFHIK